MPSLSKSSASLNATLSSEEVKELKKPLISILVCWSTVNGIKTLVFPVSPDCKVPDGMTKFSMSMFGIYSKSECLY